MTEFEIQQTKDTAALRAHRCKIAANIAREALEQAARSMEDIANVLRSPHRRADFVFESRPWLSPDALYRLIQNEAKAQQEFVDANAVAASLGEGIA